MTYRGLVERLKAGIQGDRKRLVLVLLGLALFVLDILNPINSRLTRFMLISVLLAFWATLIWLSRKANSRWFVLGLPFLAAAPFALPGRPVDVDQLKADYLANLRGLVGTRYIWGGESGLGIDCSGLPRLALRRAYLSQGLAQMNGTATRAFLFQWWNDASAKALGEGHLDYTYALTKRGEIRTMNFSGMQPGDLAVTRSGAHILAYLGGEEWIQADPGVGHVAIFNGRKDRNPWFGMPVTIHRWLVFDR